MDPMTIKELSDAALLIPGARYLCVKAYTPENAPNCAAFIAGATYDALGSTSMCSEQGPQSDTPDLFVEVDDEVPVDLVKSPSHYARLPIQPIEFIIKNDLSGHVSNIVKYACRAGHKIYPGMDEVESEVKDLEKAKDWAEKRIRHLTGEPIC